MHQIRSVRRQTARNNTANKVVGQRNTWGCCRMNGWPRTVELCSKNSNFFKKSHFSRNFSCARAPSNSTFPKLQDMAHLSVFITFKSIHAGERNFGLKLTPRHADLRMFICPPLARVATYHCALGGNRKSTQSAFFCFFSHLDTISLAQMAHF